MRIYVLDDEEIICRAMCAQLSRWTIAASYAQTIEALLRLVDRPDLLVVDFNLRGTDAAHCAGQLEARWPGAPRIVLTAAILSAEDEARVKQGGYQAIHLKPVMREELRGIIRRFCTEEMRIQLADQLEGQQG